MLNLCCWHKANALANCLLLQKKKVHIQIHVQIIVWYYDIYTFDNKYNSRITYIIRVSTRAREWEWKREVEG